MLALLHDGVEAEYLLLWISHCEPMDCLMIYATCVAFLLLAAKSIQIPWSNGHKGLLGEKHAETADEPKSGIRH